MPTAIVTQSNGRITQVQLVPTEGTEDTVVDAVPAEGTEDSVPEAQLMASSSAAGEETTAVVKSAPNPIAPETKELAWAAGSFLVLFVLLRYFLFPKLKKGMDARYADIRSDIEGADQVKIAARTDVAEYEKALATARAEASSRIDAARQVVDSERTTKLAEVNSRIAAARAEADQQTAAARQAAQGEVAAAVAQVAAKAAELASGKTPDPAKVQAAVAAAMQSAGSR